MQHYSSDEEISSIPEDEYQDYDRQDFEAIQFADNKQNISEADEENDDENEDDEEQEHDNKLQKNGIKFRLPQRNQIENKKSQSNLNNPKILTETTNQLKNISKIENRPSTSNSSSYKPIYTTSIHQSQQMQKKYNYKQKSFNTLPKRSDPVARYQQMSQQWKKTKFLQNTNGMKEGRKLNLDTRIEQQKQELKESGMFHRYVAKSQLFL
ncbi:unnamed protein product (macronuclear) [Paramecium tetraurelia]|uniref:Uncharacterized protein n=1 Tax=Paramecium tetraurelia TaxID=5888 RepID=A0CHX2_PARTE|nr:uncharacterized protein GSPATT00038491001 [Paramecium tetraurelia]CAK70389.1 unnamed protein product [Paramecium tetraurelia]|eukprot:XP_001437786.1 hypothetical protein (macronuclear) [Paramecium tetraurelia strain d4-2]